MLYQLNGWGSIKNNSPASRASFSARREASDCWVGVGVGGISIPIRSFHCFRSLRSSAVSSFAFLAVIDRLVSLGVNTPESLRGFTCRLVYRRLSGSCIARILLIVSFVIERSLYTTRWYRKSFLISRCIFELSVSRCFNTLDWFLRRASTDFGGVLLTLEDIGLVGGDGVRDP